MDTELKATTAVKDIIAGTDYLEAFIREKDKEPCWDGYVCIHSDKHYSKTDIKKVNVQVKGLAVNTRKVKEHISFPVGHEDLIAFLNDGGSIFFVVYISKATRKAVQIYYVFLLPEYIKRIIKTKKSEYSIRFKKFPSDIKKVEDLFVSFCEDSRKQASFSKATTIPPTIFARNRDFNGFSFSISGMHPMPGLAELPRYLEDKSLSIYGHVSSVGVPIPVDYIDEIHDVEIKQEIVAPISVNGIKYYDAYSCCYFKDKIVLQIGSCVTITINEDKTGKFIPPYQAEYKLAGTLSERIKGLQFVIAAMRNKGFIFGATNFSFNDDDEGFKSFNLEKVSHTLEGYNKAKKTLESLSIVQEVDLDNFSDSDYVALNKLIVTVLDNKSIRGEAPVYNKITALKIGNLKLAVVYMATGNDCYTIFDVFHARLETKNINNETGEETYVPQFSWMRKEDFLQYDNLNLPFIVESFKSNSKVAGVYDDAVLIALELIKAYDQSKAMSYLDSAKELFDWIEEKNGVSQEVLLINRLQITLRQRKLNYEENRQLYDLIKETTDDQVKCCAFLLLDLQDEAQKLLDSFDETTLAHFKDFPIYFFYGNNDQH